MSGTASRDPERNPIEAIILALVEPLVRYTRAYRASVVVQRADGTLDLRLEDRRASIADPSGVPIRGLPGVSVKVKPGTLVLLEYEHHGASLMRWSQPSPIATLFGTDGLDEIKITASTRVEIDAPEVDLTASASRGVASEGALCVFSGLTTSVPPVPVTGTFVIPAGSGSGRVRV